MANFDDTELRVDQQITELFSKGQTQQARQLLGEYASWVAHPKNLSFTNANFIFNNVRRLDFSDHEQFLIAQTLYVASVKSHPNIADRCVPYFPADQRIKKWREVMWSFADNDQPLRARGLLGMFSAADETGEVRRSETLALFNRTLDGDPESGLEPNLVDAQKLFDEHLFTDEEALDLAHRILLKHLDVHGHIDAAASLLRYVTHPERRSHIAATAFDNTVAQLEAEDLPEEDAKLLFQRLANLVAVFPEIQQAPRRIAVIELLAQAGIPNYFPFDLVKPLNQAGLVDLVAETISLGTPNCDTMAEAIVFQVTDGRLINELVDALKKQDGDVADWAGTLSDVNGWTYAAQNHRETSRIAERPSI